MRFTNALLFLFFVCLSLVLYGLALKGEFIMDDWGYITENAWVARSSSPWHFWTTFHQTDFWPLSYSFYWLFFKTFGSDPIGYHVVNVAMHAVNGVLVFLLARDYKVRWPLWAALLFLVHPLHVQAVAWIIQFKTLLATAFAIGVLLAFRRGMHFLALVLFAASLLSKTSAVLLPFVLIAEVWHKPRKSWWKLAPFFVLMVAGGCITLYVNDLNFQERSAHVFNIGLGERLLLITQNLIFYPKVFFWPHQLAYMYPLQVPELYGPSLWLVPSGILILLLLSTLAFYRPWAPYRLPIFSYLALLFPALGIVAIPNMKLSLVSDHWAYLPDVFMVIFLGRVLQIPDSGKWRLALALPLLLLGRLTALQAQVFATEARFWTRAREVNPNHPAPYYNLGFAYGKQNEVDTSIEMYKLALQRDASHHRAWFNLGRAYFLKQEYEKSEECFLQSLKLDPELVDAYLALATVYQKVGSVTQAKAILEEGLRLNPANSTLTERFRTLNP